MPTFAEKFADMDKGVLFDLDGVVIDSETIYTDFWIKMEKIFPTGIDNFAIKIKGSTLQAILGTYYPDPKIQEEICKYLKVFEKTMVYTPFAEAMRFINELNEAKIKCAIVTSSSMKKMENLFTQNPTFKAHFDAFITGDMVHHSKPHPEPYLLGAEALNIDIKDCYVFEDSLQGIQSGKNAGATVIGLATTLPYDTIEKEAHKTIKDFKDFHIQNMIDVKIN